MMLIVLLIAALAFCLILCCWMQQRRQRKEEFGRAILNQWTSDKYSGSDAESWLQITDATGHSKSPTIVVDGRNVKGARGQEMQTMRKEATLMSTPL